MIPQKVLNLLAEAENIMEAIRLAVDQGDDQVVRRLVRRLRATCSFISRDLKGWKGHV